MHCLNNTACFDLIPLLQRYDISLAMVAAREEIPGTFWGAPEAGRLGPVLYARADTPLHSVLHEAAHYVCMPADQRISMQNDAKGSAVEESACCFLQIILCDYLDSIDRQTLMHDMDTWGYSFRLGSAERWFTYDSDDAQKWLLAHRILTSACHPTWRLR